LAEAGTRPTDTVEVDVAMVLKLVLDELAGRLEKANARVEAQKDLGTVQASTTHVYQVFANLISNAINHTDSPEPLVKVSYLGSEPDGSNRYLVCDNGPGIPEADLEKVFIPFFKGPTGQTGIGLSTVRKVVELYDGYIKAYNGDGACFEFSFKDLTD
jgi:signal transduction histidine kinase